MKKVFLSLLIFSLVASGVFAQDDSEIDYKNLIKRAHAKMEKLAVDNSSKDIHFHFISSHFLKDDLNQYNDQYEHEQLHLYFNEARSYLKAKDFEIYQGDHTSIRVNNRLKRISLNDYLESKEKKLALERFGAFHEKVLEWSTVNSFSEVTENGKNMIKIELSINTIGRDKLKVRKMDIYIDRDTEMLSKYIGYFTNDSKFSKAYVEILDINVLKNSYQLSKDPLSSIYDGENLKSNYAGYAVNDNRKLNTANYEN